MSAIGTTFHSIWRFHGVLALILVLEYAFTFAIFLAMSGLLVSRVTAISQSSGVDEDGLYVLQGKGINQPVHRSELLDAETRFQGLVGRGQIALGSSVPFLGAFAQSMPISDPTDPNRAPPLQGNAYEGSASFASVLGVKLLLGRWFRTEEVARHYGESSHVTMLSLSLAQRLFHGEGAVGKQVNIAGEIHTVTGIISPLAAPAYLGDQQTTYTFLLPKIGGAGSLLLIRYAGEPAELDSVLFALNSADKGRVNWTLTPYAAIRTAYFESDRLAVVALVVVICLVLVIALCGILGLTNYWVSRRRKQIATRRALGAKKLDISLHFLGESGLLVVLGVASGLIIYVLFITFFGGLQLKVGPVMLLLSVLLMLLLAEIVVHASLRRWLRMSPAELIRTI